MLLIIKTISLCIIVLFSAKRKGYVLKKFSEGSNNLRYKYTYCKRSLHAEEEAIRHLPINNKKKKIKIQILVVRSTIFAFNAKLDSTCALTRAFV